MADEEIAEEVKERKGKEKSFWRNIPTSYKIWGIVGIGYMLWMIKNKGYDLKWGISGILFILLLIYISGEKKAEEKLISPIEARTLMDDRIQYDVDHGYLPKNVTWVISNVSAPIWNSVKKAEEYIMRIMFYFPNGRREQKFGWVHARNSDLVTFRDYRYGKIYGDERPDIKMVVPAMVGYLEKNKALKSMLGL